MTVDTNKANEVKWVRDNTIFADILLRADEDEVKEEEIEEAEEAQEPNHADGNGGIPIGAFSQLSMSPPMRRSKRKSVIFPAHRAMLLRSEFFLVMFSSSFREAQVTDHLQIVSIDCTPEVLEIVLRFLYTEKADFPLEIAVDVLFAADLLLIEKLKTKTAVLISTLGSGNIASLARNSPDTPTPEGAEQPIPAKQGEEQSDVDDPIDVYEIIRAGWLMRVQRLEEFAARYLAYKLEAHIDSPEFEQLVIESAERIQKRQETDSIELIDDIRYYLSERFRLRFEDSGIDMLEPEQENVHQVEQRPGSRPPTLFNKLPGEVDLVEKIQRREQQKAAKLEVLKKQENGEPNPTSVIRTLDGQDAGDEFSRDAINYEHLLNKLDKLLERLGLDA
ncbi:ankyrin repeat and BTB/POZ domain-containing protein [Arthroderma uncinatum]|uniref:ankyrin repeat and BTB/POZ domain-containing protein n=1 Tax=Arthroderma uncinatum TaxID=74035 RepID=UPI00144A8145|nr:ankyrin repeat and BTB/POZ domain-containing protein [Arthroderma uncinatum]KAF3490727.1 ankyrin repeat and BTB/POZ domain-containing protein [Arthroderma uncinatum]